MTEHDRLRQARDDLAYIVEHFDKAWRRLRDAAPALPAAAALDRDGTSGHGPADPTQALALTGHQSVHDRQLEAAEQWIRNLAHDARLLRLLVADHAGRRPTAKDRRDAEQANTAEPECEPCRTHANVFEPVRAVSDASGVYEQELPLCRWHTDFARRVGRPASRSETERHARGQLIRLPVN